MEIIQETKVMTLFRKVALILSWFMILIGLLVQVGWQFDINFLRNFYFGNTFMNPLTAVNFVLIGIAVQIVGRMKMQKFLWLAGVIGISVFLVGFLRLVAILFGFDTRIDQYLFGPKLLGLRMAPNTALSFVLLGIALFFIVKNKYFKLINVACWLVVVISYLAMLGYFFNATGLYGILSLTPMSLPTAVSFSLAALAILFARPDRGILRVFSVDSSGGDAARRLIPLIFIFPAAVSKLILVIHSLGFIEDEFSYSLLAVSLSVIFLGIMYELINSLNKSDSERQQIEEKKQQAEEELRISNVNLDKELKKYQEQNNILEDTSTAMINILEDAREFEGNIQKERDHIKGIVSSIGEGIFVVDNDYRITLINPVAEKLLEMPLEEAKGKSIIDVFSIYKANKKLSADERPVVKVLKTGKSMVIDLEGDLYFVTKNKKFPVAITATPILKDGNVTGGVVAFRDIAGEKFVKEQIEKQVQERTLELSQEKAKLQASISNLSIGFIMTDRHNNILMINQSARKILCASSSSPLATMKDCTLGHIEDELKGVIDLRSVIVKCLKEKKPTLIKELEFQNRYIKFLLTPILGNSLVLGTAILVDDITETKLLERSRDEFFSIASHELRTPLTAIRGNTSMIQQYYQDAIKGNKDLGEMIEDIHESSIRLISIVNDFLDTSRLELGKMEFKKEEIEVEKLTEDIVSEYLTTCSVNKLYIKTEKSEIKLPKIIADKDRVKQIIINLLGNALKFTQKGGITIKFSVEKDFVKVLVSDTGKGISPESQNLLFRKFQQAGESIFTRDSVNGTGLGLYISRMMAQGMGGDMKLESSALGKGSVFSVSLPIAGKLVIAKIAQLTK